MKKKFLYTLYVLLGHIFFITVLLIIAIPVYYLGIRQYYFVLFCIFLVVAFLPVLNFYYTLFNKYITDEGETYLDTVDSVLSVNSLDEFLERRFLKVLQQMNVLIGMFFLYDHEKDEYSIFYQKDKSSRVLKKANIDRNNIILKVVNSAEDLIIKSRLNESINFEKNLLIEMEKLNAGIIVPIYYNDHFQGLMILEDRKKKFSNDEISILKIFASKIGILAINNQLWKEEVKKKELEKEFEMGLKVRSKFFPMKSLHNKYFNCYVHFEEHSTSYNSFYDLFPQDNFLMISSYSIEEAVSGTGIYIPAINALLQSYARLKNSAKDTIEKLKNTLKAKALIDGDLSIFYGLFSSTGQFEYYCENYPIPFLFNYKKELIEEIKSKKVKINPKDIIIITDKNNYSIIKQNIEYFTKTFANHKRSSLEYILGTINKYLNDLSYVKENSYIGLVQREEVANAK